MIKEIKVILQKQIPTGGLRFTVVEMVPVEGGFPKEQPLQGATVTILQSGRMIFKGSTDANGIYQETGFPLGSYDWAVELAGYGAKQGAETVA